MSSTSTQCLHLRSNRTTARVAGIFEMGQIGKMLAFVWLGYKLSHRKLKLTSSLLYKQRPARGH